MYEYRVGKIYHTGKTSWEDGTDYNYRSHCHELRMFFSQLTQSDIRVIRSGSCSFHLVQENSVLFFLFEFGLACPLSDNSFNIYLVHESERTIPPELDNNEMALLSIALVSSEDGIIRALRQISLGHDFSVALHKAIREQEGKPFDRDTHNKRIAEVYRKYPTTQALLKRAYASCFVEASHNN